MRREAERLQDILDAICASQQRFAIAAIERYANQGRQAFDEVEGNGGKDIAGVGGGVRRRCRG